jgi:hypothetical protein
MKLMAGFCAVQERRSDPLELFRSNAAYEEVQKAHGWFHRVVDP